MAVKKIDDVWYEVAVRFSNNLAGAEESLRQIFSQIGCDDASLISTYQKNHGYLKVYCKTRQRARQIISQLALCHLKKVKIMETPLAAKDWRDKWKEEVRPFPLTKRFDVVPSWNMDGYSAGRREAIYLDTILSFGTGLHETTRFMAELIEGRAGLFDTFLDIGTGTGLLSLMGAKCGAKKLWAIDIDAQSVETAQQNLARNGVAFDRCLCMDFRKCTWRRQFDFVAANVITDELIAMKANIIGAVSAGKYLAVSGISRQNLSRFRREFEDESLRCLRVLTGKAWTALLYRKCRNVERV